MKDQSTSTERRDFLKKAAAAAMVTGFPAIISAQTVTNAIKVGLVGCGGRGSGAASQALTADDYAELTAIADVEQSAGRSLPVVAETEHEDSPRV